MIMLSSDVSCSLIIDVKVITELLNIYLIIKFTDSSGKIDIPSSL